MKTLHHFTLPILGLKMGVHQFDFQVDSEFFNNFDQSVIKQGEFDVRLYFDKRPDMIVLIFEFEGHVQTTCDRCLATIKLPVKGNNQLMVKYAEAESEEDEIWYIPSGTSELNVAKPVYEFITLSLPIIKNCDDTEESSCDEEMLRYLQKPSEEDEASDEDDESPNPFRDALKDFK
ncbi:MAG: DUF177 domain-containing protein [Saprospiraceae bacterium]